MTKRCLSYVFRLFRDFSLEVKKQTNYPLSLFLNTAMFTKIKLIAEIKIIGNWFLFPTFSL